MNKLLIFFMASFLLLGTLVSWMDGGGGNNVTTLTSGLSNDPDIETINVNDTSGFYPYDYIIIGEEYIKYEGKTDTSFTDCTRGYSGTTAAAHPINTKVLSSNAEVFSSALGFNVAATGSTAGEIKMITCASNIFTITFAKLITWDFTIFKTSMFMEYVRVFLQILSIGFIFSVAVTVLTAMGGVFQGIFGR